MPVLPSGCGEKYYSSQRDPFGPPEDVVRIHKTAFNLRNHPGTRCKAVRVSRDHFEVSCLLEEEGWILSGEKNWVRVSDIFE